MKLGSIIDKLARLDSFEERNSDGFYLGRELESGSISGREIVKQLDMVLGDGLNQVGEEVGGSNLINGSSRLCQSWDSKLLFA